jgi:hypothetical protein
MERAIIGTAMNMPTTGTRAVKPNIKNTIAISSITAPITNSPIFSK